MRLKISQILKIIIIFLLFSVFSNAQVKITSYNLLNYPGTDTTTRNPYFRTVINSINPDILVVQEITSQDAINGFLNGIMNISGNFYSAGTFINGPDSDNGIFFKTSLFSFISNTPIKTALRDINEFKLVCLSNLDTLRIYSAHLKASTGTSNELLRAAEVDSLRKVTNTLPFNSYFIVCGDFNLYRSGEPAYQKLLEITTGSYGNFNDALNMIGTWNNSAYASYHTQSSRVRSFGGGASGGLDDRFDFILYSSAIKNPGRLTYVLNSLTAYGNDGNHYNDSINKSPNTAVSQFIANAIHYASDHLPVYALFSLSTISSINLTNSNIPSEFKLSQNYPNPYNPTTKIIFDLPKDAKVTLVIYDILGRQMAKLASGEFKKAGTYMVEFNGQNYVSGVYFYKIIAEGETKYTAVKKMMLVK
jgi:endonuclease/exonuclease/phosphatase family metal-dependent hydrolase